MTDQGMIEKVARALVSAEGYNPDALMPGTGSLMWELAFPAACAAIEAMREPTDEMVIAGCQHENMGDMAGRYRAMIDAVLEAVAPITL